MPAPWQHGLGVTIIEVWGRVGASINQTTCKCGLYLEYYVKNACLNVKMCAGRRKSGEIK